MIDEQKEKEALAYNEDQIQILEGLEPVRRRPGMYIGSTSESGLHHLVYEIVDNAIDEALAGFCDEIQVEILEDGACLVRDNGRGAGDHASGTGAVGRQTSIQPREAEAVSSSAIVRQIALLLLPHAGYTVSNLCRETSRYTRTFSGTAKGQTPPTAWPTRRSASSGGISAESTVSRGLAASESGERRTAGFRCGIS